MSGAGEERSFGATDLANATVRCEPVPPLPPVPCDILNLVLKCDEGGAALPVFDTLVAAAAAGSKRPRDVLMCPNAPKRIADLLESYDFVIEMTAPEVGRAAGSVALASPPNRFDVAGRSEQRDALRPAKPPPSSAISVVRSPKSECGDPAHASLKLIWNEDRHGISPRNGFDGGAALQTAVFAEPVGDLLFDLESFVAAVFDPIRAGARYAVESDSCGVPAAGPATRSLNALVIAYPTGVSGLKLGIGPLGWNVGWGMHAAADARNAAVNSDKVRRAELEEIVGGKGAGSRPVPQTDSRAARARFKADRRAVNRARADAKAELGSMVASSSNSLAPSYWATPDADLWDATIIISDRELGREEVLREFPRAKNVYDALKICLSSATRIKDGLMLALNFMRDYAPSAIKPTATIDIKALLIEAALTRKLVSNKALQGPRWRAVTPSFNIDVVMKIFEVSGSLGIMVGYRLLGTGATAEAVVTIGGSVVADYNWQGPLDESSEPKIKGQGEITASGALIGQVTFAWFDLAQAGGTVSGSLQASASCAPGNLVSPDKWERALTAPPIVATLYYWLPFGKKRSLTYTVYAGGEKSF